MNRFSAQASAAKLANALLSTQSLLAQDYFQLRVADEQRRILETTVADYKASLRLVRTLFDSGVDSEADIASAETQLDSAMAQATDVGVARAQYEHAIAVLIGVAPAKFSIPYEHFDQPLPTIPVGCPPICSSAGRTSPPRSGRSRSPMHRSASPAPRSSPADAHRLGRLRVDPFEPLLRRAQPLLVGGASLAQVLFDGGARRAAVPQARALNDAQAATYRQTVLSAFQSVEDNLAALRILSQDLAQSHRPRWRRSVRWNFRSCAIATESTATRR